MKMNIIREKDIFNLDIENFELYDCQINNQQIKCNDYVDLLKYLMEYICDYKNMNELVNQSNYPSFFETELYDDNVQCNHFNFDFLQLNKRQMLNEIFELVHQNQYSLSFIIKNKNNNLQYMLK